MPPECTLPPPSEDGKDSEDIVENWNFKIYIGGRVLYQPTVHYLGGKSWDYAITPKEMNIDKLDRIIEELANDEKGEGKEAELAAAQAAYVAELAAEKVAYAAARKRNVGPSVETNGRDTNTTFMPTPRLVKKRKGKDLMANAPKKPWK
ncbi:hypothetical protein ACFE04_015046 [Oxalis oulophora]